MTIHVHDVAMEIHQSMDGLCPQRSSLRFMEDTRDGLIEFDVMARDGIRRFRISIQPISEKVSDV